MHKRNKVNYEMYKEIRDAVLSFCGECGLWIVNLVFGNKSLRVKSVWGKYVRTVMKKSSSDPKCRLRS
jgi:hypothetical protein